MNFAVSFVVENSSIVANGSASTLFNVIVDVDALVVNSANVFDNTDPLLFSILTSILLQNSSYLFKIQPDQN